MKTIKLPNGYYNIIVNCRSCGRLSCIKPILHKLSVNDLNVLYLALNYDYLSFKNILLEVQNEKKND